MSIVDRHWATRETAMAFAALTDLPAMANVLRHYPAPTYQLEHVEAVCRVFCFICEIDAADVDWEDLSEAVIHWVRDCRYDVVPERAVCAPGAS